MGVADYTIEPRSKGVQEATVAIKGGKVAKSGVEGLENLTVSIEGHKVEKEED